MSTYPKKNEHSLCKGFTIMELLLVITISALLVTIIVLNLNVVYNKHKSEDNKRLSDLTVLDRIFIEHRADTGSYPDTNSTLRNSTILPVGSLELTNPQGSWIPRDLHIYSTRIPIDPVNNDTYHYECIRSGDTYEINAVLHVLTDFMLTDGGNDPNRYEIGNDLTLISP